MTLGARDAEALRRAFLSTLPEPDRSGAPPGVSAVLIPVHLGEDGAGLLYTRRAETLRRHPGEVSFPGGRVDPTDASPVAAALRETEEEIGLAPADLEVLGHLTDYLTYRNVLVCAYVALLREGVAPPTEPRSRDEVAQVFRVPVASLLDPACYEARRMPDMEPGARVHYWRVRPRTIWGITGEITARYLAHAHAWRPPDRVRVIRDPAEFLPAR
ncbi:MAG TPA: CoA pyrophosphatase [Candidatus Thermoplasmatota archaeon]|nr:CoA pyrophosphatase [Candidatus Thermoplasmatota archaeon]